MTGVATALFLLIWLLGVTGIWITLGPERRTRRVLTVLVGLVGSIVLLRFGLALDVLMISGLRYSEVAEQLKIPEPMSETLSLTRFTITLSLDGTLSHDGEVAPLEELIEKANSDGAAIVHLQTPKSIRAAMVKEVARALEEFGFDSVIFTSYNAENG